MQQNQLDAKTVFWNRVQLIAVLVVFIAPIAGAFLYKPTKFNNYGDLYTPAPEIAPLALMGEDGKTSFARYKSEDLWAFLVIVQGECNEQCERSLLNTRQLRAMQGKHLARLRSVFIYSDISDEVAKDLAKKYQPMDFFRADSAQLSEWRTQFDLPGVAPEKLADRFYVVDSKGLLMISYASDADYKLVNKDLKRLLKARR